MDNAIINKITGADANTYIIFFVPTCRYSQLALQTLRNNNLSYKGYDIGEITGGMPELLRVLNKNAALFQFDTDHKTKPIIFFNGKFIGGADDLSDRLAA